MGPLLQIGLSVGLGLATGWAGGALVRPAPAEPPRAARDEPPILSAASLPGAEAVVELPPITTNLADGKSWARLELSLVFADTPDAATANRVHADALAYLRTLAVHQIASPSAYLFLRSDLAARAADLTDGAVTGILVRTFLIE